MYSNLNGAANRHATANSAPRYLISFALPASVDALSSSVDVSAELCVESLDLEDLSDVEDSSVELSAFAGTASVSSELSVASS